jgi:hypothetical protein
MIINDDLLGRSGSGKFARRFRVEWTGDDYPPDSNYWKYDAIEARASLAEMIGVQSYNLWSEITWPGETINNYTFKELSREFRSAISLGADKLLEMLECACVMPDHSCRVCCAQARITARVEELL